jgi:hypothetical protein
MIIYVQLYIKFIVLEKINSYKVICVNNALQWQPSWILHKKQIFVNCPRNILAKSDVKWFSGII